VHYNEQQKQIIYNNDKHVLVLAGAGCGKTSTIIARINYLVAYTQTQARDILCLTFSNKAAKEMKERLTNEHIYVGTFHKFSLDSLGMDSSHIAVNVLGYSAEELKSISLYKNKASKKKPLVYNTYQKELESLGLIDFDDMLINFYEYLLNSRLSFNYKYIFVDEFQDTNLLQYQILQLLAPKANIFAVGDPDQAIYAFRGANRFIINEFIKDFKPKQYFLLLNYRCCVNIINCANSLINQNIFRIKKELLPTKEALGLVFINSFNNELDKVEFIIHQLYTNINQYIGILYRLNKSSFLLRERLDGLYTLTNYRLLSIHQAKGLEFDIVFLIDCNDSCFPGNVEHQFDIEEERRILFVGASRARYQLYFLYQKDKGRLSRLIRKISFINPKRP
jgi:DNA helicase-2/ATP-dependent DNA helicase PcrA